jgi:hypothetical protein
MEGSPDRPLPPQGLARTIASAGRLLGAGGRLLPRAGPRGARPSKRCTMKYVMIFQANLNDAYLTPDRYACVIRRSYDLLLDTMAKPFPRVTFVFEASGNTLDEIARRCLDVRAKLKNAIAQRRCEFMESPYAHPMLATFPEEDGACPIRFSNETYERHLGFLPQSFWNPECGWRSYVPREAMESVFAMCSNAEEEREP